MSIKSWCWVGIGAALIGPPLIGPPLGDSCIPMEVLREFPAIWCFWSSFLLSDLWDHKWWFPGHCVRYPNGVPGFCLWCGPALVVSGIWGVNSPCLLSIFRFRFSIFNSRPSVSLYPCHYILLEDAGNYSEGTWIIQDNLPISKSFI